MFFSLSFLSFCVILLRSGDELVTMMMMFIMEFNILLVVFQLHWNRYTLSFAKTILYDTARGIEPGPTMQRPQ